MPVPQQPYIVIQTGAQLGEISPGGNFSWYNSGLENCTVTISGNWCTQSSYGPILPSNSVVATVSATAPEGSYNWSSGCTQNAMPVHVSGGHPM